MALFPTTGGWMIAGGWVGHFYNGSKPEEERT